MLEWTFWIALITLFYTYVGYGLALGLLVALKRLWRRPQPLLLPAEWPEVCLFVTAYNEADCVAAKVENSLQLNYPASKLKFLWITDGSDDGTPELLTKYPGIRVEHLPERRGKVHAMNRGMQFVDTPYVVFTDANTMLSPEAIQQLIRHFQDPQVACVAGEKRVLAADWSNVAAGGEKMYWSFESTIKQLESELSSVVGAAGELFALRTSQFQPPSADSLLDDFQLSMGLAIAGYRVVYEPAAVAVEQASLNVSEELKRKNRIAAGGLQSMVRMPGLLNPFRVGWLSFQYFSHKVLRWTLAPWALVLALVTNILLVAGNSSELIYIILLVLQGLWYLFAGMGFMLEGRCRGNKLFFIPYYFTAIHIAAFTGLYRLVRRKQSVAWEQARRA
ncbi:glycosyltransferase family 2 protein [Mangrovibacterium marinum]|uniref:Cellulose synthase/poly-beta-1,6-N-acetylglucosamine synthase-like glycosyltransferase n=1 Tax=Mangrovibacterium marinum TaxID=1639118 RepID=A0A2T5C1C0_9BACT|nr:glycosyltransferase family 2 protein [Mangrovibacterium marinum]PTN08459.1 cellulose synthase/poly-beta-1,6-N-acetylglucosamine synthase-like glycosyltransferase [Mangrovibacterium marinum]